MGNLDYDKRPTGMGERPDDKWTVPLCVGCHMDKKNSLHRMGEEVFWNHFGINPFKIAMSLYERFTKGGEKLPKVNAGMAFPVQRRGEDAGS
jgi:membrane carboxypeptidase/penicillin-binding protein PbpC